MRDFECEKKNYLVGSALAVIFLHAKHAGAVVFKMIFWTPGILFNIDLSFMARETKSF